MANTMNRGIGGEQRATGVVENIKDKAQDLASTVADRAEDAWDATRQGTQQAYNAVTDTAEEAWDSVTMFLRRYPFAVFCAGIGVGFLLTRLLEEAQRDYRFGGRYFPGGG